METFDIDPSVVPRPTTLLQMAQSVGALARAGYVVALDEFQYFARQKLHEFTSHLQAVVDELSRDADRVTGGLFVLGSLHTELVALLEDRDAPLYNRTTDTIELDHLDIASVLEVIGAHAEAPPEDAPERRDSPAVVTSASSSGGVAASLSEAAAPHAAAEGAERRRIPPLWIGLGVAAAALLLLAVFARGSDDDDAGDNPSDDSASAPLVIADAEPSAPLAPLTPAEPALAALPDLPDLPADVPPDLGGDLALADALDVGSDLADALDVGSAEDQRVALAEDDTRDAEDALAEAEASRTPRRGKNKRRGSATVSDPRPAPATPTTAETPDADTLLADAKAALAAGQARKAYTLASKSRQAKKTSAALIVMARAACRFGGESQAKSAFDQLGVSDRRGIRSECRDHGVRLGL